MTGSRTTGAAWPDAARRSGDPTRGWVRLARAGVLGGASLILATAAHRLGGGALPGAGLLAVTGVALALIAVTLTARRLRLGLLLGILSAEQLLLHLLFHASTAMPGCAAVAMPGHSMAPLSVCADGASATGGWSMLVAHVLAVAATAWLLARGERWLWRVIDRVHGYAGLRPTRRRRVTRPLVVCVAAAGSPIPCLSSGSRAPPVV